MAMLFRFQSDKKSRLICYQLILGIIVPFATDKRQK